MNTKVDEGKLISGKEALIALANGEEVEYQVVENRNVWNKVSSMAVNLILSNNFKFRLKPRTITLNGIEMPAPFEPEEGEEYWYITDCEGGYEKARNRHGYRVGIAGWRTEEEIKQVVAALRQVFGGSHDN